MCAINFLLRGFMNMLFKFSSFLSIYGVIIRNYTVLLCSFTSLPNYSSNKRMIIKAYKLSKFFAMERQGHTPSCLFLSLVFTFSYFFLDYRIFRKFYNLIIYYTPIPEDNNLPPPPLQKHMKGEIGTYNILITINHMSLHFSNLCFSRFQKPSSNFGRRRFGSVSTQM